MSTVQESKSGEIVPLKVGLTSEDNKAAEAIAKAKEYANPERLAAALKDLDEALAKAKLRTKSVAPSPDPDDFNQAATSEEQLVHLFNQMDPERILTLFAETFPDLDIEVTFPT